MSPSSAASPPPRDRDYCLFLDFDGTLVDLKAAPGDVTHDAGLVLLLRTTVQALEGAVAIISGRPIDSIDALIAPLKMAVAGVHGFERRGADGIIYRPTPDFEHIAVLRQRLQVFVSAHPGLLLEDKAAAVAVHFRNAPFLAERVREYMQGLRALFGSELELLEGSAVIEIKSAIYNKATAVAAFMREAPFAGRTPIYIGDDRTDCDGFDAVEDLQGISIAVGTRVCTSWHLHDPAAVRAWLEDFNNMSVRATES